MNSTVEQKKTNNAVPDKKAKKKYDYFVYDFVKVTGFIPTFAFLRTKTICTGNGKPNKIRGGALISANHLSYIDPVVVHTAFWRRRIHCIATKEIYAAKAMNWFFQKMHCIKVDRENFSMSTFHGVKDGLSDERLVLIFPEGQLNHEEGTVLAFKSGAILMAHQCNKPIIPVYIVKRNKWYERQKVMVGDPIDVRALCGKMPTMAQLNAASEVLRQREVELMEKYEELYNKKK